MNLNEALKTLADGLQMERNPGSGLSQKEVDAYNIVHAEIDRLKSQLDTYTKPCPVCGGSGLKINTNLMLRMVSRDCPACNGSGYEPRMIVSDWFIEKLKRNHMKVVNGNLVFTVTGCIYDGYDVCIAKLTRLPDGMWEITEAEVKGDDK